MLNLKLCTLGLSIAVLTACGDRLNSASDESPNALDNQGPQLELKLSGIDPLSGQHYEGWLVNSNGVVSTGRFNLNDSGLIYLVNSSGEMQKMIGQDESASFSFDQPVTNGDLFVLTIEPDGDNDDGPSSVHYVGGSFNNSVALATTDHSSAIGAEFSTSSGSYILATPSNGPSTHNQGIWFLDSGAPSLQIPTLNTGWAYEGWVVNTVTGEAISTGTFSSASGADSDGAGATAGPNAAPPFPGQDFINPARILNDGNYIAVISVEPSPDFDPAPFTLKILKDEIISGAPVTTSTNLDNFSNETEISIEVTAKQ